MIRHHSGESPGCILIVDDNPVNLSVVVDHLEAHGYEVLVALGGEEALERARYALPDLILLDVMMPEIDGLEVCRRLKADPTLADIPVIFMTALNDLADKVAAFEAGGVDFVSKPFQTEELLARARTHLALRRALRSLAAQKNALETEMVARAEAQEALKESEQRHRRQFEAAADGILVMDCETECLTDINAVGCSMVGIAAETARERPLAELPIFQTEGSSRAALTALRQEGQMTWDEWSWLKPDGTKVTAEVTGSTYRAGGRLFAQCTFRDIGARKEAEARVRFLAHHDPLTELPNRAMLMERLTFELARAARNQSKVGLLLIDLDHFKHINDSMGHRGGDLMLAEVAKRLKSVLRRSDIAARLGGDEFVVVMSDIANSEEVETLAERIIEVFGFDFAIDGRQVHIGASIGIASFPVDGGSPEALLQAADMAMYHAKKRGRGNHRSFAHDLSITADRWHILARDLPGACERGELTLHYQPQISLETGAVTGLEALLRWEHPSEGVISPGLFIPLLEEHGGMVEVGRWALRTACTQNKAWQDAGLPPVRVAVNLSARQFYRGDIVTAVREALEASGLAAGWLELELTESLTLADTEETTRIMTELKALGVHLSLDDFGTGWSSLSYLRQFPIDRIKIDRSFVQDVTNDTGTAAIVNTILDLARQLKLDCVAEGIETQAQFDLLRDQGCPGMQGFLFSQGLEAADVAPVLMAGGKRWKEEREARRA